ncbi:hypothetical protein O3G_MSEX011180 [Manduca sexta]|uniref:Uncharacterized protein n=1 Tax=Manduca sexta TaxID=7130 RepID=A0A921ZJ78_MANSE|nr:hypothetical protein O3G_MSEX011180 [Manduca sexta]KAG6459044.1 hypothetical protein O3G_MSEX011180 [Manduca sexta]
MYCELPLLKRCCFCLPLRPGLIAWGYIKTVAAIAFIGLMCILLDESIERSKRGYYSYTSTIVIQSIILTVTIVDAVFSIIFLVSAHKKHERLMKSCLYYQIFIFVVSNLAFSLYFIYMLYLMATAYIFLGEIWLVLSLTIGFMNAVLQFYLILLVRSVVHKLGNDCTFQFENNAVAAQCHMNTVNFETFNNVAPTKQDKLELIKEEYAPSKV